MDFNKLKLFVLILLVLGSGSFLFAEPPPPPPFSPEPFDFFIPGGGPGPREREDKNFERFSKELSLTPEQIEKSKAATDKRQNISRTLGEKLPALHESLRKLLESPKVDLVAVKSKLKEISDIQLELRFLHIQGRLEFEAILNPEQKQKLNQLHKERLNRLKERRDFPPHRHGPPPPGDRDCKNLSINGQVLEARDQILINNLSFGADYR
ncbi:Spy/CpxP family protein refolding chaperone [Leptospira andrefontaineae]|uniref:Periplasmic heavy metal sensor n=1 Tax=Leptospira andrefontaineae TaxID=2484976 RepID=A0A4R9H956_9LEPT|nr:periplasmic heavy metal sensor [Leptospira andrefontaineae]TGK42720.1 periplasmic heavy metal sensor [Leptospira andrefontaineae]